MKTFIKRTLIGLGVVLLVLVGLVASIAISAFGSNIPIQDGAQVTPTARIVRDGFVSATVLDLGNGSVALIDAGNDPSGKAILSELQRRGLAADAVAAILLTHGHGDHIGGCRVFPHADVYAMAAEVPLIEGRARPNGMLGHLMPLNAPGIRVTHPLHDGESFVLGNRRIQAFATPGHTSGSAVYLVDGALYFGDSAMSHKDGKLHAAVAFFSEDPTQNVASLVALARRLQPIAPSLHTLVFAHSGTLQGLQPLLDFAAASTRHQG